jgi:hypothetical protein
MDLSKLSDSDLNAIAKGDLRMMSKQGLQMLAKTDDPAPDPLNVDPTEGNSFLDNTLIGIGKGMTDVYQGGKQALGLATAEDVAEKRRIDAPLMNTGGGKVGNIIGQTSVIAPTVLVPGANTYTGAALIGAGTGGLQPVVEGESRLENAAYGAAGGVIGQKVGNVISNKIGNKVATNALRKSQNATRDAALREAQEAGFDVPRSLYDPTFTSNRIESFGGKAAVRQQASANNQNLVNSLARKTLGVSDDTPISIATVESVRKSAYKPYEEVAEISVGAKNALRDLKQYRADAKGWFNAYNRSARPDDLAKAQEFQQLADISEQVIDDYAKASGKPELVSQLTKARQTIAKTYTVERAMNRATGDIDPRVLGRLFEKGKPLSDGLDVAGKFASAFPQVAKPTSQSAGAGISALEPMSSAGYAAVGQIATGNPMGLLAGGIPLLRGPARRLALSKLMQTQPQYGGLLLNSADKVRPALPAAGMLTGITLSN